MHLQENLSASFATRASLFGRRWQWVITSSFRSSASTSRGYVIVVKIGTSTKLVFKMSSADAMYGLLGGLISNQIP